MTAEIGDIGAAVAHMKAGGKVEFEGKQYGIKFRTRQPGPAVDHFTVGRFGGKGVLPEKMLLSEQIKLLPMAEEESAA